MKIFLNLLLTISLSISSFSAFGENSNSSPEPISQAELEQILAPIALYPDTVLSHILIASTYPLEVIQAERWTTSNPSLKGSEAVEAVSSTDWDPSVKALVAFPQILKRLSEDLEWTQRLGDAFLQDEQKLLASVQTLRQRAYDAGSLDEMDKVTVTHEDDSIVIEPIEREIVYVPYYDSRVVYGPWHWSSYPPVYWNYPYNHRYAGHYDNPFYWGPRIDISFGFFFSSFHWGNHHIVRISNNHYQPHHYYNHNQIVGHRYAERWTHNPSHRRGVAYPSAVIGNRYKSQIKPAYRNAYDVTNQNLRKSNNLRTSAPLIKKELRDNRVNSQIKPYRSNNIKPNKSTVSTVVHRPIVNRTAIQKPRKSNSVQVVSTPTQAVKSSATAVYTRPPARATVARSPSPSKVVKSSRQPKKQNTQTKAHRQSPTSTRKGTKRHPM